MIPSPRLNVVAVVSSVRPHSTRAARVRSVRWRRSVHTSPATRTNSASGSSHEIWPPYSVLNIRNHPVAPHIPPPAPAAPAPPPTEPVSLPLRRPKPLYPKISSSTLLCCDPPMYGRLLAGH